MENSINPMSQLPQLLEALLMRLEAMLADQTDPLKRARTEILFQKLRKQTEAMRTLVNSVGEGLTPEQANVVSQVPVPQVNLFPSWTDKKEK